MSPAAPAVPVPVSPTYLDAVPVVTLSPPHVIGTEAPTDENDPAGRYPRGGAPLVVSALPPYSPRPQFFRHSGRVMVQVGPYCGEVRRTPHGPLFVFPPQVVDKVTALVPYSDLEPAFLTWEG
jgi:hypothetical protein